MARYAIVRDSDGLVLNVAEWDGVRPWSPPPGRTAVQTDAGGVGDTFTPPSTFTPPDQGAVDAAKTAGQRAEAVKLVDDAEGLAKLVRAVVLATLDEINLLREQVVGVVTFAFDPASLADGAGATKADIAVSGAAFGDAVDVLAPYSLQGIVCAGYVHAANTVAVRLQNETGGALNLASGTWRVAVRRHANMPQRTPAQVRNAIKAKLNDGDADS
jgi:hypothetical protein